MCYIFIWALVNPFFSFFFQDESAQERRVQQTLKAVEHSASWYFQQTMYPFHSSH